MSVRPRKTAILTMACLALAGCSRSWESTPPTTPPGGAGIMETGTLKMGPDAVAPVTKAPSANRRGVVPPFGATGEAAAYEFSRGYRVGTGDRLTIRVMGQPELTGIYVVDPAGNLSMPLIGSFRIAGLTPKEIEALITRKLKNGYLRNPSVSVQPAALRPFYILGEVKQAGNYPYQPGMTVQNAIAIARGYSDRADHGDVLLTRRTAKGTNTYKVPVTTQIYPGDIIYVRERWF